MNKMIVIGNLVANPEERWVDTSDGRQRFAIDLKNEELVSTLKTCVQQDSIGKSVNLFLNMDTAEIELESNPS